MKHCLLRWPRRFAPMARRHEWRCWILLKIKRALVRCFLLHGLADSLRYHTLLLTGVIALIRAAAFRFGRHRCHSQRVSVSVFLNFVFCGGQRLSACCKTMQNNMWRAQPFLHFHSLTTPIHTIPYLTTPSHIHPTPWPTPQAPHLNTQTPYHTIPCYTVWTIPHHIHSTAPTLPHFTPFSPTHRARHAATPPSPSPSQADESTRAGLSPCPRALARLVGVGGGRAALGGLPIPTQLKPFE